MMKLDLFKNWLTGTNMDKRTIGSRLSNCRTVEKFEGDLDEHFADSKGQRLIQRLEYGADDERSGRDAKHRIPIEGDIRNGTATLKSAVKLYFRFAENLPATGVPTVPKGWPKWENPTDDEILGLAHVVSRYARFLVPEIVQAVVQDNERQRVEWLAALERHGVDGSAYLWEQSPCAFPGVRRYAGRKEIAEFGKKTSSEGVKIKGALRLDDNDFPKQIWSHVFLGKMFPKHGPVGYALAHLADHKSYGNRHASDFNVQGNATELHGLFTAVTNSIYVPVGLIKPTDFGPKLRSLLMRRAVYLYGQHCKLLPPWLEVRVESDPKWALDQFKWAPPVGDCSKIDQFLAYRKALLGTILNG